MCEVVLDNEWLMDCLELSGNGNVPNMESQRERSAFWHLHVYKDDGRLFVLECTLAFGISD